METLIELIKINSNYKHRLQMIEFIVTAAKMTGANVKVDVHGNIIATKGKGLKPCIVAHYDTVHNEAPQIVKIIGNYIYGFAKDGRPIGTGGDDKCGIYIALEMLKKYNRIKAVFFTEEETGCIGSNKIDMDTFNDCRFVMQSDRRGASDLIFSNGYTEYLSEDSKEKINNIGKKYKMSEATGSLTDITTLVCRDLHCGAFYYSSAYYFPHTEREIINIEQLKNILRFTEDVIENVKFLEKPYKYNLFDEETEDTENLDSWMPEFKKDWYWNK